MTVETLIATIEGDAHAAIVKRVKRAIEDLTDALRKAYASKFAAGHGAAGAVGAIEYAVQDAERFVEATIGLTDAAKYLRNLEFGERGTSGGQGLFARSKAPPVTKMYDWLRLANIKTPDFFVERAKRFRKKNEPGSTWTSPASRGIPAIRERSSLSTLR
jgi:hypothetical protein